MMKRTDVFLSAGTLGLALVAVMAVAATAYLKKRGLERPPIPWDEIEAVKEQPPWSL